MFNHQPKDYDCPFCNFVAGKTTRYNDAEDIVYKNDVVTAFIAPGTWPNNKGHVIVIPNQHFENIYDISDDALSDVYKVAKKVAIAIRSTYDCEGITIRQHNEPAGDQDVWHLHVHVFPRYTDDGLYRMNRIFIEADERAPYAQKLRAYFDAHELESR
jgi:histidine triad (HIT) family protein